MPKKIVAPPAPSSFYKSVFFRQNRNAYYLRVHHITDKSFHIERALGTNDPQEAKERAAVLFASLPLEEEYHRFVLKHVDYPLNPSTPTSRYSEEYTTDDFRAMKVSSFCEAFWDKEKSPYIHDKDDGNKKLSGHYIRENHGYIQKYVIPDPRLSKTPLAFLQYDDIEKFVRYWKKMGKSYHVLRNIIGAMSVSINWAAAHNLCKPVSFEKLPFPAVKGTPRGILTMDEVMKIFKLETERIWYTSEGRPMVGNRPLGLSKTKAEMLGRVALPSFKDKLFVCLGLYFGTRKGELRALRWKHLHLETDQIDIFRNIVPGDPEKDPKQKSQRTNLIPVILQPVLFEAKQIAQELHADGPEDFVLMNEHDANQPVGENIGKSWKRILRAIGISEEEQKLRHLVYHSTRHFFTTLLLDNGLNENQVGKLTGHRVTASVKRYADHLTDETRQKAEEILNRRII